MAKRLRGADKCALIVRGSRGAASGVEARRRSRSASESRRLFALQVCGQAVHEAGSNDGVALELDGQAAQEIVALVRMNRRRRLQHGCILVIGTELILGGAIRGLRWRRGGCDCKSGSQGQPSSAAVNPGMYMSGSWMIGNGGALSPERP
jgi:hypothetical protein